jgi:hypothetical protein
MLKSGIKKKIKKKLKNKQVPIKLG